MILYSLAVGLLFQTAASQSGGFVATLGNDTVHLEAFRRTGDRIEGIIATRSPVTRVVLYQATIDPRGRLARYEMETRLGDGTAGRGNGNAGFLSFEGDSIVRETLREGAVVTQRLGVTGAVYPGPGIPYVGVSYLIYELAFGEARARAAGAPETTISLLTMNPGQSSPQRLRAWLVSPDSAELDYFGVARSGYRFDQEGRLIRADWTRTTYRYQIARTNTPPDVQAVARVWAEADRRGAGMGPLSPRDTLRGSIAGASILIDYSRPARRGRVIWGDVVPWNKVWRLGADMATHLVTTADLRIGGTLVPAGTYTLWMQPEENQSQLIISSLTSVFGTAYSPARDFARVPLSQEHLSQPVERLTISVEGENLRISWGDRSWTSAITPAH